MYVIFYDSPVGRRFVTAETKVDRDITVANMQKNGQTNIVVHQDTEATIVARQEVRDLPKGDSLGDRMKGYERASQVTLPKRMPVIIRVDGKAFHTLTKNCQRPFDDELRKIMDWTAMDLCKEIQGAVFAYVQSDEISVLVHNYKNLNSDSWFGNNLQKMVSIAASRASATWGTVDSDRVSLDTTEAMFDARAFVLPEAEVVNYFVWRQQDAIRNSVAMAAQSVYSAKELHCKTTTQQHEMLLDKGIDYSTYPREFRHGRAVLREIDIDANPRSGENPFRWRWSVVPAPIFTEYREFIDQHLGVEDK